MRQHLCVFGFLMLLFTFAQAAPSVSSSTMPDPDQWYSPNVMRFSWDEGQEGNQYAYLISQDPGDDPGSVSNISENELSLPPQLDGVWYFHIKKLPSDGITHFKFQIDRTAPRTVTNAKAEFVEASNGIQVTWGEAEDALSGLSGYTVYRQHNESDFDIRFAKVVVENHSDTSYLDVDPDFAEGFTYFYKIVGKDQAGNAGPTSKFAFSAIPRICDATISISPRFDGSTRILTVEVTASNSNITNANLRMQPPESQTILDLVTDEDDTPGFTGTADLSDYPDGDATILLTSVDPGFDACNVEMAFPVDSTSPTITWSNPAENAILENTVTLQVTAQDLGIFQTGIQRVEFYYKEDRIKIGETTSSSNGTFSFDWDTTSADNGRFPVFAVAYDAGNNTAEAERIISLNNKIVARQAANSLLSTTRDVQQQVQDLNKLLMEKNIFLPSFPSQVLEADGNFSIAEGAFEREQFDSANRYAGIAQEQYQALINSITLTDYRKSEFQYLFPNIDLLMDSVGFSQHLREEVKTQIQTHQVTRELNLTKVSADGNQDFYIANVTLYFTNRGDEIISVQLLEVIPKELMPSARELFANQSFDVFREDPIIRFVLDEVAISETRSVSYVLYPSLTQMEADLLMEQDSIALFQTPPLPLNASTPTGPGDFSFSFSLPDFGESGMLVLGTVAIVILLLLIGGGIWYIRQHQKGGYPSHTRISSSRKPGVSGIFRSLREKIPVNRKQKTLKDIFK